MIIYDEKKIKEFHEKIISPISLDTDKVLLMFLVSRKKYFDDDIRDLVVSESFLRKQSYKYNDPLRFVLEIRKLFPCEKTYVTRLNITRKEWYNIPDEQKQEINKKYGDVFFMDAYNKKGEKEVYPYIFTPVSTMSVYIDLNPKSTISATSKLLQDTLLQMDMITKLSLKISNTKNKEKREELTRELNELYRWFKNYKSKWLSELHKSNIRPPYFMVDIDTKNNEVLDYVISVIKKEPIVQIETRNGYHLIYPNDKEIKKNVYIELVQNPPQKIGDVTIIENDKRLIEVKKEVMTVIPGTLQGGFKVNAKYNI